MKALPRNEVERLIDEAAAVCYPPTRAELARALGVHRQQVSMWASGKQACPVNHAARIAKIAGRTEAEGIVAAAARKLARATTLAGVGALAMLSFGAADPAQAAGACGKATTMYRPVKSRWGLRWVHRNAETALRGRFSWRGGVGSPAFEKSHCRADAGRWRPTPAEQPLVRKESGQPLRPHRRRECRAAGQTADATERWSKDRSRRQAPGGRGHRPRACSRTSSR
jgi:DNA-binding transcriptional regulator YdaS (Cro superfamily)